MRMERTFSTHEVRRSRACEPVWTLETLDAGGLDRPERVIVPGVWESHPALTNYRGRGVFRQRVSLGGNVRLWLGGVSFRAKVYLDDHLIAGHYGAYTGFEALAKDVPRGEHVLSVEVDNRFGEHSALHVPNDYYAYGGINRPVLMEELGEVYIARCQVSTRRVGEGWTVEARVVVRSLSESAWEGALAVSVAGGSAQKNIRLEAGAEAVHTLSLTCADVRPWTPDDPALYAVNAVLTRDRAPVDDLIDRTGFREVRVEGRRILLNGKPLLLKGFNRHEDCGGLGLAVPVETMMRDLQLMRDMGANCVRTSHYPNDPRFLDLCDEMGMLVWEESHARGFEEAGMRHPLFMKQLRQSTEEMVAQHFNHPCIFIWGCLNECADDTRYGAVCYREIFGLLKALDDTRPVTAALLERPGGTVYGDMDVVSVNLYPKWYHDTPVTDTLETKLDEVRANSGADKPVIVSEIGAGAIYGFHDPLGQAKWSEERQCAILTEQITAVLGHPDVSGIFIWQFADVRVDESWAAKRPNTRNNKGVVDEYRRPKMAYAVVKKLYHTDHR